MINSDFIHINLYPTYRGRLVEYTMSVPLQKSKDNGLPFPLL
jgi:hypothetical protein